MQMFDVQGIEIQAPRAQVFEFLRRPENLPHWAHAFVSVGDGRARLETPAGAVDVALSVSADAETGVVRSEERRVGKEWRCRWAGEEANKRSSTVYGAS